MRFDNLRLYTQKVNRLVFPSDKNYMIIYFSENSDLISDYPKLNIRRKDFRHVVVPNTRIPRTYLTPEIKKVYTSYGLRPFSTNQKPPNQSFIFDISNYLNKIETTFEPQHYRQRSGSLITNLLRRSFTFYDNSFEKIFLYSIDRTKDFRRLMDMKIFPIIEQLRDEDFYFNHMLLGVLNENKTSYRLLVKDGEFNLKRIISFIRGIKPAVTEEEVEEEFNDQTNKIANKITKTLKLDNEPKEKLKDSIYSMLQTDEELFDKVTEEELSDEEIKKLTIQSVLYKVSGNIDRATQIANSIPKNKQDTALKRLKDSYIDQIIPSEKVRSVSDDIILQMYDIINSVDGKNPSHIFNKRQIDFETNLKNDLINNFKILENKEVPIKLKSFKIEDKSSRKGELQKTDLSVAKAELEDKFGNKHKVEIDIPKINPDSGTFTINGRRHCLVNQIILCPISFPKMYMSKFQSSYSSFHIWSKRTKHLKYLEIYMGSYKLPLFPVLSFSFGFDKVLKQYGINYKIVEEKPDKTSTFIKINNQKYVIFNNVDSDLKKELIKSIEISELDKVETSAEFPSSEFFSDAIYYITGRTNATYLIQNNLDNVVDPIAKQVLINMSLPYKLENIIYYMASKVVEGFVQDRNDISNQRVRGSEVVAELAQKQILAAYTEYREQVLAGNENAKFDIQKDKVLKDFQLSEIVVDMEYANPIEEMAMMTRISPVGKQIGGIPDRRALQGKALNVHNSYFGNIDPLDTPEGETIGINQQLTIDSALTSSRGMFSVKEISDDENAGLLSVPTSLIPFIETNDSARVIMAANQSRQMLPLLNPEPPLVQSGYESIHSNFLSNAYLKKSPCKGKVTKIDETKIEITCDNGEKQEVDISPESLRAGTGKHNLSIFKKKVSLNQSVREGQIIAEGSGLNQGTISLGRTLLCAVMSYKGHNFEDGVVISEKLVNENLLTSIHGIQEEVEVNDKDKILNIVNIGQETNKGDILLRKTIGEMEELLGYQDLEEDEEFTLLGRDLIRKSPGGKVVDIEVFSNIKDSETKFPKLSKYISNTDKKYNKPKGEKYTIRGETIKGILVVFKIEQRLPIKVGDKLANRFGNKGIISLIEKEENMPRTDDGEPVDIILNPLGIIGRMNLGQLFELYVGLISRELGKRAVELNDKNKFVKLLRKVLPLLDTTKQKTISTRFIDNVNSLSDKKFKQFIDQVKKDNGVPVIIPPFKGPKHSQVYNALKELGLKSGYKLKLPEYNVHTKQDVPIGYMYISKLEHMAAEKIHSRSTGPVTGKVMQPTAGKRRSGGQRLGEGDTYSLISYNALNTLQEFFGPLSDDPMTKNEIISDIVQNGHAEYREPKRNESKDLVNAYFTALILDK